MRGRACECGAGEGGSSLGRSVSCLSVYLSIYRYVLRGYIGGVRTYEGDTLVLEEDGVVCLDSGQRETGRQHTAERGRCQHTGIFISSECDQFPPEPGRELSCRARPRRWLEERSRWTRQTELSSSQCHRRSAAVGLTP